MFHSHLLVMFIFQGFEKKLDEFFALEEEINQAMTKKNIWKDVFKR